MSELQKEEGNEIKEHFAEGIRGNETKYVEAETLIFHCPKYITEQEKQITRLNTENDTLKTSETTYENSIKEFQNKIKAIVGNDLTQ
ncbi:8025_t:CDS:2 [Funneliformis geosporum]|uniref:8025_t:CDS:1 n=1 Tax=Funneliformis geosporum TaxID=1117311 RepID=A0A9W4SL21_9GLOM|nr:8025_t:CDS:2 [Funneliformis geosporum]